MSARKMTVNDISELQLHGSGRSDSEDAGKENSSQGQCM
jgi:hypothetical protein